MLAYVLAWIVGLGSLGVYLAAFFFPEIHRKNDFIWSGIGFFYALVLWVYAERLRGGILLGQTASVTLLVSFGWQTLKLRRQLTPLDQQTQLPDMPTKVGGITSNLQRRLANLPLRRISPQSSKQAVTPAAQPEQVQKIPGTTSQATQSAIIQQPSIPPALDRSGVVLSGEAVESEVIPPGDATSGAITGAVQPAAFSPSEEGNPTQQVRSDIADALITEKVELEVEEDLWVSTTKAPEEMTAGTPKTKVAKSVAAKDNLQSKLANLPIPKSLPNLQQIAGFTRIKNWFQDLSRVTQRRSKPSVAITQQPITSTPVSTPTAEDFGDDQEGVKIPPEAATETLAEQKQSFAEATLITEGVETEQATNDPATLSETASDPEPALQAEAEQDTSTPSADKAQKEHPSEST